MRYKKKEWKKYRSGWLSKYQIMSLSKFWRDKIEIHKVLEDQEFYNVWLPLEDYEKGFKFRLSFVNY